MPHTSNDLEYRTHIDEGVPEVHIITPWRPPVKLTEDDLVELLVAVRRRKAEATRAKEKGAA